MNNLNTYMTLSQQATNSNKNKSTCNDLTLPNLKNAFTINVNVGHTEKVSGGMDGACQEIATNIQDGAAEARNLPHVMHDRLDFDTRIDHRAPMKVLKKQK